MRFSATPLLALASASAATASVLGARSCYLLPANEHAFSAAKDLPAGLDTTTTLSYHVGPSATNGPSKPCSLVALFSEGFPVEQSGENLLDVRGVSGVNAPGSIVGSFRINTAGPGPQTTVINSFVCQEDMAFEFEISSDDRPGSVAFTAGGGSGLFLQVGQC